MSSEPRITVLLAVRNGMPYLPQTVASVLGQTFADFELLVLDDGSTDDTPQYVRSIHDTRLRCRMLDQCGVAAARNEGLRMASAPWIGALDADDVPYPGWLESQWELLRQKAGCAVAGCQVDLIDENGGALGERRFPVSDDAIRWQMAFGSPMVHSGAVYQRALALDEGGYHSQYIPAEDYELWSRLIFRGAFVNHRGKLMRYRLHAQSVTSTRLQSQIERCGRIAANYAARVCAGVDPEAMAELYYFLASASGPGKVGWHDLARAYRTLKAGFLAGVPQPSAELRERIHSVQRTLRWHCLERAEAAWYNPARAWAWLRLARAFDPENASVPQMVSRWVRRRMPRRGP